MTLPSYTVYFRGHPACPCQVTWLPKFEFEAQRRGYLLGTLPISQLIGGAVTSGGTHALGGAADFYPLTAVTNIGGFVALAREMGADATWLRPVNWDGTGGVQHVHSVLTDCPHNSPARYQIDAVRAGYNGLGSGGRGASDTGPRPLSGRTWRQGVEWATKQEEFKMDADAKAAFKTVTDQLDGLAKQVARVNDRGVKRDQMLADLIKRKSTITAADLAKVLAAVDAED